MRREWFPSIVDIGIEIDAHEGSFDDLLPHARSMSTDRGDDEGPDDFEGAQSVLRHSSLLGGTASGRARYPLDWQSMRSLFLQLQPSEARRLGLVTTEDVNMPDNETSYFNFDHITSSYGDVEKSIGYISEALLFPVQYLSRNGNGSDEDTNRSEMQPAMVAVSSSSSS